MDLQLLGRLAGALDTLQCRIQLPVCLAIVVPAACKMGKYSPK